MRDLEDVAEAEDESLIFGSEDDGSSGSLLDHSLPDSPIQELIEPLSPPRRPPIYDDSGEEMKIPEMTDEDFNASFGEQLAKQGVKSTSRSTEAIAEAGAGAAGAGALAVAGKGLKTLLESDDNDFDTNNIDMLQGEKTDQIAYHSQNVTQASTQATTQATTQAATQGAAAQGAAAQGAAATQV
jgi:hypothetical protein